VDGSGNVVVTGHSWDVGNYDYLTVKYAAADGALLWEKRYNGPANDYDEARAVAVDGSGNVVVTGRLRDGRLPRFARDFHRPDFHRCPPPWHRPPRPKLQH